MNRFDVDLSTSLDTRVAAGRHLSLGIGKSASQTEVPVAELGKGQDDTQVADYDLSRLHQRPDKEVLAAVVEQLRKALGALQSYAAAHQALGEEGERLQ